MPKWSWDEAAEGKRAARAGDGVVRLWHVDAETSVKDPRGTSNATWEGCRVFAFTARFMGTITVLVEADAAGAAQLRSLPGVRSVELSEDRRYFDDRSDLHVSVTGGLLNLSEE
jgi:hypothetical protein